MSLMKPSEVKKQADWAIQESRQRISGVTTRSHLLVFKVSDPATVFVRATRCKITVQYHDLEQVELRARLVNAFGLQFVTDQDEAGVYIIAKRRRFLGWFSRAEFTIHVPRYANMAFNLTPGSVQIAELDGVVNLPPLVERQPKSMPQAPTIR